MKQWHLKNLARALHNTQMHLHKFVAETISSRVLFLDSQASELSKIGFLTRGFALAKDSQFQLLLAFAVYYIASKQAISS